MIAIGGAAVVALLSYKGSQQTRKELLKAIIKAVSAYGALRILQLLSRKNLGLERERSPGELWAAQREEEAHEPEVRIFDAHHHLWDFGVDHKPGISSVQKMFFRVLKPAVLNNMFAGIPMLSTCFGQRSPFIVPFMGSELLQCIRGKAAGGHDVVGTLYMECGWQTPGVEKCMEPAGEVDMVKAVHEANPSVCQSMVAFADLNLGKEVEPLLKLYGSDPFVKGIRHSLWFTEDEILNCNSHAAKGTANTDKFREGFALLSKYDLTYDCWLSHENLEDLADMAKNFPQQTIICDHIGFPLGIGKYKLEEVTPVWKERMAALAQHKNVHVKVGGLGMTFLGFKFDEGEMPPSSDEIAARWGPYVLFTIETFGVDRCLMESNFPMDRITCSYTMYWNAMKKIVKGYSKEDKAKLFETNALRTYNVKL